MLVIELRFPTGRVHATPWGRHVNEGAIEWPLSPWRVLRALIAVWRRGLLDAEGAPTEEEMRALLFALAAPPRFALPPASQGHTRHYVPLFKDKTTKIFDAFAVIDSQAPVRVVWPEVDLATPQRVLLERLLRALPYLGRAESLVDACVGASYDGPFNAVPASDPWTEAEDELVPLLCPLTPEAYLQWRASQAPASPEGTTTKKKPAKPSKKGASLPASLFEALHADTLDLQAAGWSLPPGAAFVAYRRRADAFTVRPVTRARTVERDSPRIARFAVTSAVRPRLTEALFVAERQLRPALLKLSDGAQVFLGRDESGEPLEGNGHVHLLCEAAGGSGDAGRISHLLLHAPMGFDPAARKALLKLRKVWGFGGHDLQLVLQGIGNAADFDQPLRDGGSDLCRESTTWESVTPFVPTRHPKVRGGRPALDEEGRWVGSAEHDVRRLLDTAGLPTPSSVTELPQANLGGTQIRWAHFRTLRTAGGGPRSAASPVGFRIVFPVPVRGPLALGYGAHFGLGVFATTR